jgi:phosphoribosylaminoimidazole (AIR) synthetase
MGIGMVIIVKPSDLEELRSQIEEPIWVMGGVTSGNREVDLV